MPITIYITRRNKFLNYLLKLRNSLKRFYTKHEVWVNQALIVLIIALLTIFALLGLGIK